MNKRKSLKEWYGPKPVITRNSPYKSAGDITITISVEMAAFLLGRVGYIPCNQPLNQTVKGLAKGEYLDLYRGIYDPVHTALTDAELLDFSIMKIGRDAQETG